MKKIALTLVLAAFAMAANAQFILGGQLEFNTNGGNTHYEAIAPYTSAFNHPSTKTTDLRIAPTISYVLNDKMQVGLSLMYVTGSTVNYGTTGKFNFFCEATLTFIASGRSHTHAYDNSVTPVIDVENDGPTSYSILDFSIVPGVNYKFNDKWSADCYINLAGLAFTRTATKNYGTLADPDALTSTNVTTNFGLIANSSAQDLNAHLGNFSIGINYHF